MTKVPTRIAQCIVLYIILYVHHTAIRALQSRALLRSALLAGITLLSRALLSVKQS